ncbi:MAG: glycosyl transferase family 1 [Planctomycetota bacterium]|nr:MAG: glycosyl transferase family 1 [Planctomycetota bacterium]
MRTLILIHDFLPHHAAGSEIYAANLARALVDAGHEVSIFCCEENRALEQHTLTEREWNGLPIYEAIDNRIYHDLAIHWDDARMAALLDEVCARVQPELVHVMGLQSVGGVSALEVVRRHARCVLMTLHEYWWLCPRHGLMYDLEGRACTRATSTDCARCVDVYPIDRERWSDEACDNAHAELGTRRWFARALDGRRAALDAAVAHVDRFIAPSHFLAERYVEHGFPREKLVVADYGFPSVERPPRALASVPLHIGYVGTLSDYKGVTTFARAVAHSGLSREQLVAPIHGHLDWFPEVAAELRALAESCPALELRGAFPQEQREQVFAELHALVVPSLWWENSPLTIHEAFQRGVPVLASDRGGMAELVGHGGGLLFPPGDHEALAALLLQLVDDPARLDALAASFPEVRPLSADVTLVEALAEEAGSGGAPR